MLALAGLLLTYPTDVATESRLAADGEISEFKEDTGENHTLSTIHDTKSILDDTQGTQGVHRVYIVHTCKIILSVIELSLT